MKRAMVLRLMAMSVAKFGTSETMSVTQHDEDNCTVIPREAYTLKSSMVPGHTAPTLYAVVTDEVAHQLVTS